MEILLVDPPVSFGTGATRVAWPLGLGYIGAALTRAGHGVRTLLPDLRAWRPQEGGADPWSRLAQVIADEAPELVGVTGMTMTHSSVARLVAATREALGPKVPIIVGGPHATASPAQVARLPGVSAVVQGEAEHALVALADGYVSGPGFDPAVVPGVSIWRDGALRAGPSPQEPQDLDALPWPLRTGLVWDTPRTDLLLGGMITQRGCPYRCLYCAIGASTRRVRYRDPLDVAREAAVLQRRHGVRRLVFFDSVFTLHRARTLDLLAALRARAPGLAFECQTRVDRLDDELLEALAASGCDSVSLGIESGHPESLRRINKPVPLDTIRAAVAGVRAHGMRAQGFFIVGFPWERAEHLSATGDLALSLDLDYLSLFSATPLPGTALGALAGPVDVDGVFDFRDPVANISAMTDEAYAVAYAALRQRFESYNVELIQRRVGLRW